MKKKGMYGKPIIALVICVFVCVSSYKNSGLLRETFIKYMQKEIPFTGFVTEVQDAFLSDDLWNKNKFININGLFVRLSGQRKLNGVVLTTNNMLTEPVKQMDTQPLAQEMSEFSNYLSDKDIPFLFVQVPYKEDLQGDMIPTGIYSYANDNADSLIHTLNLNGIETLDLRPYLATTSEQVEESFFVTDHHWNYKGAFNGFVELAKKVTELFPEREIDLSCTKIENWEEYTLENWFLGSRGKRVGAWFVGSDDLTWYEPKFDTAMSLAVPKYRALYKGTFSDANIRQQYIEEKNYFDYNAYCLYIGGDYPLSQNRNEKAGSDLKVLLLKDSFALPMQAYLSTLFSELDVIDPRYFKDCTITEYIERTQPDLVIQMMNPSTFGRIEYRTYGEPDELREEEIVVNKEDITVKVSESNKYNYSQIKLTHGKKWKLKFENVDFFQGAADGVVVSVYNYTSKEILSTAVFDVEYCRANGGFEWIFETPEAGKDELCLIFYAGLPAYTKGIGVTYEGVTLTYEK